MGCLTFQFMVDRVISLTTGHQRPEGRSQRQGYVRHSNQKLKDQREEKVLGALCDTRIYINGYLRDTTDIEMKRIITEAGGQALLVRGRVPLPFSSLTLVWILK
jgi:hypothetical protein